MLVENYPFTITRPGDIARPYIPITIINPENKKELNVFALIDTGADECALPASFAPPLGHNLQSGYQKKISTGNGITVAYSHTVYIKAFDFLTENVLIDFMPNLQIPLLGVKSFLSNFTLKIDYTDKNFSIL
ncbi:retroviral-like aspartic protease family protein [Candidatus Desantisbacteria bacterium]|nr:retroviral-like aspartic protease family protein [Candidatus Desantisbacteria bacterium]MBI4846320.1 retroviral-like aspartic protease family protein [Candidatus Omnitrophota bacterium]